MLASSLNATGLAGRAEEYFHKTALAEAGNPETARETLLAYYRKVVTETTTPNDVFGMKIHHNQFRHVFRENAMGLQSGFSFIRSFDRHILIYRRDKVLQAISELLADESNLWNTTSAGSAGRNHREFSEADIPEIASTMARQIGEEHGWRRILRDCALPFHEVSYEDLCDNPEGELARVADYLGITGLSMPRPQTVKVSDPAGALKMKAKFLAAIGATSGQAPAG